MSGYDNTSKTTRTVAASTTLTANDYILLVIGATAGVTVTLPNADVIQPGREYTIYKDSAAFAVTPATTGGDTIDGTTPVALAASAVHAVVLVSDGFNWFTTSKY